MNYGNIKHYDIADGEGVRVTLFVSGCTNCCPAFSPKHGILTMENLTQKKQNRKFWKL